MNPDATGTAEDLFAGPGEVRGLCRALDWSATPLGPIDAWPPTLRNVVRAALDSPFPINLWCGPELTLVYNDAYRSILGSKHPASLGRPGREVWAEIWHEIGPMFPAIEAGGAPVYAEDAPFFIERADADTEAQTDEHQPGQPNAWFTFALSAVRDESGHTVAFLNVVAETTRRVLAEHATESARQRAESAEQRLRDVFTGAPAFMAVMRGPDLVFEYANDAYHQLVGHRQLIGRALWEALPEVRGQGFEDVLADVLRTGRPYIGREVAVTVQRTPGAEPEQVYVDLIYYPITEADGSRSGIVAHGSDVTGHVLARIAAQEARAEAEAANQAKSQFLAMMSHEIRTPINAVIGYTDLLDSGIAGDLTTRQREYLDRVRTSSKHLLGIVDDVLDLAKIEANEMVIGSAKNAIGPVLAAAIEIMAPGAEAKGVHLRRRMECDETLRYEGDDDRVRQVLLNLLSNALKFTDAGGSIDVNCTARDRSPDAGPPGTGPWLQVSVTDTGTGIAADQLERIFEPFIQVDAGPTRRAAGTGLGLTISRRLARMMGGDLTVESEPGTGSTFHLWLRQAR